MMVYPQTTYNPKIHGPWLEKIPDNPDKPSEWWRIRSVNYGVVEWEPGESYIDIAYSDNLEELILWADLNGVPIAKPQKL